MPAKLAKGVLFLAATVSLVALALKQPSPAAQEPASMLATITAEQEFAQQPADPDEDCATGPGMAESGYAEASVVGQR
jgi:hypothetical protein